MATGRNVRTLCTSKIGDSMASKNQSPVDTLMNSLAMNKEKSRLRSRNFTSSMLSSLLEGTNSVSGGLDPAGGTGAGSRNGTMPPSGSGGGTLDRLLASIKHQESGDNYSAVNKSSGATGAYQVMKANIPSWTKRAIGRSVSPQEFLKSPQIQDSVARYVLSGYLQKYGADGAAKAWYGGPGAVKKNSNKREAGGYPSINAYAQSVVSRMK